jgi:hypothetical protein
LVSVGAIYATTKERYLWAGIFAGLAIGVHPKALVAMGALFSALLIGRLSQGRDPNQRPMYRILATVLAGASMILGPIVTYYFWQDGTQQLIACALEANFGAMLSPHINDAMPHVARAKPLITKAIEEDLPWVFCIGFAILGTIPRSLNAGEPEPRNASRRIVLPAVISHLPLMFVPLWPHYLLAIAPVLSLSFAALAPAQSARILPLVALLSGLGLYQASSRIPDTVPPINLEHEAIAQRVAAEAQAGEASIYLWPTSCPAHVFLNDRHWMWMLSPEYGFSGRGGRFNELSRSEAIRILKQEIQDGKTRWLVADERQIAALGQPLAQEVRQRFDPYGCLWKRKAS